MDKLKIINEIKGFLDGSNDELKYLVHVEASPNNDYAECIIHPPNEDKKILKVNYTPFMYTMDFEKKGIQLYYGDERLIEEKMIQYGIKKEKMSTGNQKRLEEGYCWKYTSYKSYNSLIYFFRDGGVYPYEKVKDERGKVVKNKNGRPEYKYRELFYSPKPTEQFLINKGARLFKGFEEYKEVHKLTLDIETTGLRPEISRVFAIGVRDNRGFEIALKVDKVDDDIAEAKLIQDMFNVITYLKPAVILGHNSEDFDFYYIMARVKLLNMDLSRIPTSLKLDSPIKRKAEQTVKIGDASEKYTATVMWGFSVIDTLHAAKKTKKLNTDMKATRLKYVCQYEGIAKENRTYISGEDGDIGRYFVENPVFVGNPNNDHLEVPKEFTEVATLLLELQQNKENYTDEQYANGKAILLRDNPEFVDWFRKEAAPKKYFNFVRGKELLERYLLDDLWETEQVDELYNQSSFMLAKIVPTTYTRICTMGTASVWNLLLTAWSYERGLAIPVPDKHKNFPGGLSRCYKKGYIERLVKIDYASLYPMVQLTWDIFPMFDISGVMKKMLIYMTTTRNIYKKLGRSVPLNEEEVDLVKDIDHETYEKYVAGTLTKKDRKIFKIKEIPIKILNNSQFGALGSNISFNWSDNECAGRITCSGRIELRHAIKWFEDFKCIPLYSVTDGVNFQIPDKTTIRVDNNGIAHDQPEGLIEEMWKYGGEVGINGLIEYFNDHEMKKPFMSVDNDGEFVSCFNLARINYAVLQENKDKETGEVKKKIKLTGNSIKSSVLSEYIEEFMDNGWKLLLEGKGQEFVEYYYDYVQKIFYKQIPIKKIASKSKFKNTLKQYANRGTDVNGRAKSKQAHMELIINERERIAEELFEEHKESLDLYKPEEELTIQDKLKLVDVYMPPEPELDSTFYYYNTGYRKSHGDSSEIKDKVTGEKRFASTLVDKTQMAENPELTGDYNADKYLAAFNERICYSKKKIGGMLSAFDPEIAEKIPVKIVRKKVKDSQGKKKEVEELIINHFTPDQLELRSFDLDEVDESLHLEKSEVDYWNFYGYDPRNVWDGFKMTEDNLVHYEIYQDALDFLNEKMKKIGKPLIKSRNEKINKGDLVLIKEGPNYSIGAHNGEFINIVRNDVEVPKSEIELKLDEESKEKEEEIKKLDVSVSFKTDLEEKERKKEVKRMDYFGRFKSKFNLPVEVTYDKFINDAGDAGIGMIDSYIETEESKMEDMNANYMGVD